MSLVSRFLRSKKQDLYVKEKICCFIILSKKKLLFNHIIVEEANNFG